MENISFKLQFGKMENCHIFLHIGRCSQVFLVLCWVVLFLCVCGCIEQQEVSPSHSLVVACTIPPQEEFIRAVAGDYPVSVLVMVPPGASPHTFEPTPSQIAGLESADLYIALGSGIEFENRWMERITRTYPDMPIINASHTIVVHRVAHTHEHEGEEADQESDHFDPHVWLSLQNAARIVNTTAEAMADARPEMRDTFYSNRDKYLENLADIDQEIRESFKELKSRTILVFHPAFGYFCRDYDLTQMAVEENGREPSAKQLADLIRKAKSMGITIVFAEPEESTKQAETLARELNGTMVLISPLAGDYLENMRQIAERISGVS